MLQAKVLGRQRRRQRGISRNMIGDGAGGIDLADAEGSIPQNESEKISCSKRQAGKGSWTPLAAAS